MTDPDPACLEGLAAEFNARFARFEFALKENGFIKNPTPGARAEPGWDGFVRHFEAGYRLTEAGRSLISMNPRRQKVGPSGLEFDDVGFDDKPSQLGKVTRLLKTVRNNVVHGGKFAMGGWDNPGRTSKLLELTITILDELAQLGGLDSHYGSGA